MAGTLEETLYKFGPLLFFLVISWIFSFFVRKFRPPEKEQEDAKDQQTETGLPEILNLRPEESGPYSADVAPSELSRTAYDNGNAAYKPDYHGPVVTPEPINPKWWGA